MQIVSPGIGGGAEATVDPEQSITFHCVVEGRPQPSVFYTWLPADRSESGQVSCAEAD